MQSVAISIRPEFSFRVTDRDLRLGRRTRIMGVVNVTPDSFSDGGLYQDPVTAIERVDRLVNEGADVVDVGGESSRPGALPVSAVEEAERVLPVIEGVSRQWPDQLISIDTCKASVARQAIDAGAHLVNDVTALGDPEMAPLVARTGAGVVLMHMRGTPETMQIDPKSPDICLEIATDLRRSLMAAQRAGVERDRILVDPGIGFGKTFEDNLRILSDLDFLRRLEMPILVGTSRKSFLGRLLDLPPERRVTGSVASAVAAILQGAHVIRAHDVKITREGASVADAILEAGAR